MENVKNRHLSGDFKKSLSKNSALDQLDNILVELAKFGEADERELSMAYYSIVDDPEGGTKFVGMADRLYTIERALDYLNELTYIIITGRGDNNQRKYTLTHKGMIFLSNGGFRGDFENNIEFKRKNKIFWNFGIAFLILNFIAVILKLLMDYCNK